MCSVAQVGGWVATVVAGGGPGITGEERGQHRGDEGELHPLADHGAPAMPARGERVALGWGFTSPPEFA